MSILVVIPTFNEAENLAQLATVIMAITDVALLVVDDNSPDGTGRIADGLAERYDGRVSVLHRREKQGLGSAYVEAFRAAVSSSHDFVVQMDADFSHDPADISRLVEAGKRSDVSVGSRYVRGGSAANWPLIRWLVSRGGAAYTRAVLGLTVHDPTSGFKCFRREALARLDLNELRTHGFGFQVEMNWLCRRQGLTVVEVPIRFVDRRAGRSKMSFRIFAEAFLLVWVLRLDQGGRARR